VRLVGFAIEIYYDARTYERQMKVWIFFGPQITQKFEDESFSTESNSTGKGVWQAFENFCRNFLGNEKVEIAVNLCRS